MITDIHSLVSNQAKGATTTSNTSNLGALSKLSSELQFIEGMHPVKITSVQNAQTANGPNQLIGVRSNDQQQFTLVNPKPNAAIQAGDTALLTVNRQQTASLALQSQVTSASSTAIAGQSSPPVRPSSAADTNTIAPSSSVNRSASPSTSAVVTSPASANVIAEMTIASRPIQLTAISASVAQVSPNSQVTSPNTGQPATASPTVAQPSGSTQNNTPSPGGAAMQYSTQVTDGNRQFTLNTQHPLKAGESISVFVDKQNQLQLFPSTPTTTTATALTEGLKQALPKQITAQEFHSMVRQLNALAQSATALPDKVSSALEQLVKQLPNLQAVTQSSDGVKNAMQTSGLFSEANLATKTHLESDLKLNLSRLESAVAEAANKQTTPSLNSVQSNAFNLVSGAIERITTGQLRTMIESAQAQQDGSLLPLSMEIPIKDGRSSSVVNLHIDKDQTQAPDVEAHERRWLVKLKFDFEETGRFEARTSIQGQKVGIVFAVEQAATERMIRQRLDELRTNLRKKDVSIETLDCFQATLKQQRHSLSTQDAQPNRLIDVRT